MDHILSDYSHSCLRSQGIKMDALYRGMTENDIYASVQAAENILVSSKFYKCVQEKEPNKMECKSNMFRERGYKLYNIRKYQRALENYNKALAFAPLDSNALKLAYGNRSELLCTTVNYTACLVDLDKCLEMENSESMREKMIKRKVEIREMAWTENLAMLEKSKAVRDLFKMDGSSGKSYISADIAIIEESKIQKIVTTENIKVGTVLVQEIVFTTGLHKANKYFACYYCTTLSMNLIPCPGCRHALFCNETCKNRSMQDGHSIECKMMGTFETLQMYKIHFAFKSALKMKMMSTWEELIKASQKLGVDRVQKATKESIINDKFSLLSAKSDQVFIHGKLYYCSFACAIIMHHLTEVPSFLPEDETKRHSALSALFKITIHLYLHAPPLLVTPSAGSISQQKNHLHEHQYCALPFIGKLSHSCHPNCLAVCLNKRVALVAIEPIKPGTELTISKFGQFTLHNNCVILKTLLSRKMFQIYGTVCDCVCNVLPLHYRTTDYKKTITKQIKRWYKATDSISTRDVSDIYVQVCQTLSDLSDVTHTKLYDEIYDLFLRFIVRAQVFTTRNTVIDVGHFKNAFDDIVFL